MWFRKVKNVDYKERWLAAVALLGEIGRLTPEEVTRISGDKPVPETLTERVESAKPTIETKTALRSMKSWDRCALEITRAEKGLPPLDDLVGMKSWDKEAVIEARILHGTIN
jgi:hypothetical protein